MLGISLHGLERRMLTKKNHQFLIAAAAGGGGGVAAREGDPRETLPAPNEELLKTGPDLAGVTTLRNEKKVDAHGRKPKRALDGTAHPNPVLKKALLRKTRSKKQKQKKVWRLLKTTVSLTS